MPNRKIIALLLLAALFVATVLVTKQIQKSSTLQDCVTSGRKNCVE